LGIEEGKEGKEGKEKKESDRKEGKGHKSGSLEMRVELMLDYLDFLVFRCKISLEPASRACLNDGTD
jgi:hypothetical protein